MVPVSPGIASSPQRKPVSGGPAVPCPPRPATPLLTSEPAGRAQTAGSGLCGGFGLKLMFPVKHALGGPCFASVRRRKNSLSGGRLQTLWVLWAFTPRPPIPPPALSSELLGLGLQMRFFSAGDTVSPARRAHGEPDRDFPVLCVTCLPRRHRAPPCPVLAAASLVPAAGFCRCSQNQPRCSQNQPRGASLAERPRPGRPHWRHRSPELCVPGLWGRPFSKPFPSPPAPQAPASCRVRTLGSLAFLFPFQPSLSCRTGSLCAVPLLRELVPGCSLWVFSCCCC